MADELKAVAIMQRYPTEASLGNPVAVVRAVADILNRCSTRPTGAEFLAMRGLLAAAIKRDDFEREMAAQRRIL